MSNTPELLLEPIISRAHYFESLLFQKPIILKAYVLEKITTT